VRDGTGAAGGGVELWVKEREGVGCQNGRSRQNGPDAGFPSKDETTKQIKARLRRRTGGEECRRGPAGCHPMTGGTSGGGAPRAGLARVITDPVPDAGRRTPAARRLTSPPARAHGEDRPGSSGLSEGDPAAGGGGGEPRGP